jgi:hypothetical protein
MRSHTYLLRLRPPGAGTLSQGMSFSGGLVSSSIWAGIKNTTVTITGVVTDNPCQALEGRPSLQWKRFFLIRSESATAWVGIYFRDASGASMVGCRVGDLNSLRRLA